MKKIIMILLGMFLMVSVVGCEDNQPIKISMTKAEIFELYEQAYEEGYQDALWLLKTIQVN